MGTFTTVKRKPVIDRILLLCAALLLCLHTLVPHVHHHDGEGAGEPDDNPAWLVLLKNVVGADIGTQHLQHFSTADADPEVLLLAENSAGLEGEAEPVLRLPARPTAIPKSTVEYRGPLTVAATDYPPADPLRGPPHAK